jgi:hypothetical protein
MSGGPISVAEAVREALAGEHGAGQDAPPGDWRP